MRSLFFLLCFSTTITLDAQSVQRLRATGMSGFIIPHSPVLRPFAGTRPYTMHLGWQFMPTSQNFWDACNCFHYLGVKFSYVNFNNQEVLGEAFILSGSFEPVLWRNGRFSLSLHSGIGATWITKIYDQVNNPTNYFFSYHVSFLLFLAPILEYRLNRNWGLEVGYYYYHISNGGQKQPNRGMNFPQAAIGLSRYIQQAELPEYQKKRQKREFQFWLEGGATRYGTGLGGERKMEYNLVGGTYRHLTAFNSIGTGVEAGVVTSVAGNTKGGKYTLAPFISHHFSLGRVDFSQRMAVYIARPGGLEELKLYQRYVLLFTPGERLSLGTSLKAHGGNAQYLDLRAAWRF